MSVGDIVFIDCVNSRRIISLGPYYLQASLAAAGYASEVVPVHEDREEEALEAILARRPAIVGFSVDISNVDQSARCAKFVRERCDALVIAGGPHVTLEKKQFLVDYPHYDALVIGEGEETMLDIVQTLERGEKIDSLQGLVVASKGMIRSNGERPLIQDLDSLAFPNYANIPFNGHIHPIITSRGCPWDCVFCCTKKLYSSRRWRARSPENVVAELFDIRDRGFTRVGIWDDAFNTDVKRAKAIFRLILEEGLDLQYSFPNGVRANCLDDELVSLMRRAGVVRIPFGVEDLDPDIAKGIGKNLKLSTLKEACELLHRYDYKTEAFMIVGLPGATPESTLRSLANLEYAGIDLARWYIAVPYTNTDLYRWVEANARMLPEEEYGTGTWSSNPPVLFETEDFKKAQRLHAFYYCNASSNNFLPLGGEVNRSKPMVALRILARVLYHRPDKLPRVLPWLVGAAINPMKHIFNEPFRRLDAAARARIERGVPSRPSPRTTNWVPTESLRAQP
ncbi:MAG TPA: hypothetical protein DEF51_08435 [Myxococcales bacterium]|nr:hypothetical protein [Myxococcales bacterium]